MVGRGDGEWGIETFFWVSIANAKISHFEGLLAN